MPLEEPRYQRRRQAHEDARRGRARRPAGIVPRRVAHDEERRNERRLTDGIGEGRAARAVDRVEIVDGNDDLLALGALARADDRPAKRLGDREAKLVGRELAATAMLEDVRRRPRRASAPAAAQSFVVPPSLRQVREANDRVADREVADLGPRRIGPDLDDEISLGLHLREELAEEARLAHAHIADDASADERALRIDEAILRNQSEVLIATDELERELRSGADRPGRARWPVPGSTGIDRRRAMGGGLIAPAASVAERCRARRGATTGAAFFSDEPHSPQNF